MKLVDVKNAVRSFARFQFGRAIHYPTSDDLDTLRPGTYATAEHHIRYNYLYSNFARWAPVRKIVASVSAKVTYLALKKARLEQAQKNHAAEILRVLNKLVHDGAAVTVREELRK